MDKISKLPSAKGSPDKSNPLPGGILDNKRSNHISSGKHGKLIRMLSVFVSGASLNTFDAKEIGDTCLHSTVSDLQKRYGIKFSRAWEGVLNKYGTVTRVLRYNLDGADLERARQTFNQAEESTDDCG